MSDRVDLRRYGMQAPTPKSVLDSSPAKTERDQLRTRDNAVLPRGDRRDRRVHVQKTITVMAFCTRAGHGPSFGAAALRGCALGD